MRWTPQGVVAIILATSLGGAFASVYVIAALSDQPVNDGVATLIDHLGSMLAGALAGWMGGVAASRDKDDLDDQG